MDNEIHKLERQLASDPNNRILIERLTAIHERINWKYQGRTIPQWCQQLYATNPSQRCEALVHLAGAGPVAYKAIPEILPLLKDGNRKVRKRAFQALERFGPLAVPELSKAASNGRVQSHEIHELLKRIGPSAIDVLSDSLQDEDQRFQAAHTISRLDAQSVPIETILEPLLEKLRGGNEAEQKLAALAINRLKVPQERVFHALIEALDKNPCNDTQSAIISALGAFPDKIESTLPIFFKALDTDHIGLKQSAVSTLRHLDSKDPRIRDKVYPIIFSNDTYLRADAAQTVVDIGLSETQWQDIESRLRNDHPEFSTAMSLLSRTRTTRPSILPKLLALTNSNTYSISWSILMQCLRHFKELAQPATPKLMEHAHHCTITLTTLLEINPDLSPLEPLLLSIARSNRPNRFTAIKALGSLPTLEGETLQLFSEYFENKHPGLRKAAIEILHNKGLLQEQAIERLHSYLQEPHDILRLICAKVLASKPEHARRALLVILEQCQERDKALRVQAVSSLGQFPNLPEIIIPALERALQDRAAWARQTAASTLVNLGEDHDEHIIPALISMLSDSDKDTRTWTIRKLGELGKRSIAAIPRLEELQLLDSNRSLTKIIAKTIEDIQAATNEP